MKRWIPIGLATLALALSTPAAVYDNATIDQCLAVLNDPHAASGLKSDACFALSQMGPRATTAVDSLLRQTHYDMPSVREDARQALIDILGPQKAASLNYGSPAPDLVEYQTRLKAVLAANHSWKDIKQITAWLDSDNWIENALGVQVLLKIYNGTSEDANAIAAIDRPIRARIATNLLLIPSSEELQLQKLRLIRNLHAATPEIVVPLLELATPDDPPNPMPLSTRALTTLIALTEDEQTAPQILPGLISAVADPSPSISVPAIKLIEHTPDKLKSDLDKLVASAVQQAIDGDKSQRLRAIRIFEAIGQNNQAARENIPKLLLKQIAQGDLQSARLAKTFKIDATESAVIAAKSATTVRAKLAALQQIQILESNGKAVDELLQKMLRDEDDSVREAVAQMLGTPQAKTVSDFPIHIREVRTAQSVSRRLLAANQLHEAALQPPAITAALVRAVKNGDMAARTGLVDAISVGFTQAIDPIEVLRKNAATTDPATRAYAKAAIRELENAH